MRRQVDLDDESRERIEELEDLRRAKGRLGDAMNRLSPKLAEAVELRVGSELPFAEVASRLGCSEAAARARVSRALSRLAEELEERT
jgi:RNA polymerase sigma-70 factor (ECF subfamily)